MNGPRDDTLGDKVLRFGIGAVLGLVTAWFLSVQMDVVDGKAALGIALGLALGAGGLSILFGNAFIEGFIRGATRRSQSLRNREADRARPRPKSPAPRTKERDRRLRRVTGRAPWLIRC
jgi:hypothetical protein